MHWGGWDHLLLIKCSVGLWKLRWWAWLRWINAIHMVSNVLWKQPCWKMVSSCAVLVLAAKPPNQTDWYCSGAQQHEERSRIRRQSLQKQPWCERREQLGLNPQALAAGASPGATLDNTGQSQTNPLVPYFGVTSGKAAWLQGNDFE